jgi:putative nucleotidyltransferase with HDIG domain
MRLFRAITLMLVFLTAAPVVTVGLILILSNLETLKTLTWEAQQDRADQTGQVVVSYFGNLIADLDLLASSLSIGSLNTRERQELLSFVLQKRSEVNIIAFYDATMRPASNLVAFDSNRILPSELSHHQAQVSSMPAQAGVKEPVTFSAPYQISRAARPKLGIPARQESVLAILLRIEAADIAYLGMEVSLAPLQGLIHRMWQGRRGQFLVSDLDQNLVLASAGPAAPQAGLSEWSALLTRILGSTADHATGAPRVSGALPVRLDDGREVLAAYAPLSRPPWLVLSVVPLDEAYRATRTMTLQVIWVAIISLVLAGGLGVLFAFGITRPIARCVTGALAIARGRFGTTVEVTTHNEIGELAHTFNYMSRQLQYYDQTNKDLLASLERGYLETIRALANSIDAKDPYTRGHSNRVTAVALAVARELDLNDQDLRILRYGCILHDIGKIGITEQILGKQETLTDAEREVIRQHPVLGEKIIAPIDFLQPVRPLVRYHHERVDGHGYPDGLKGEAIPLGARILNAADTFDAVTSDRPYQAAVDNRRAVEIIRELLGNQIDQRVGLALILVIERRIAQGQLQSWGADGTEAV